MQTVLKVRVKYVYGNTLVYPECPQSQLIAELLHKKTLPKRDLDLLKKIGFEFDIQSQQFEGIA